jgi:hypothetical protein
VPLDAALRRPEPTCEGLSRWVEQVAIPGRFPWVPKAEEFVAMPSPDVTISTAFPTTVHTTTVTPTVRSRCVIMADVDVRREDNMTTNKPIRFEVAVTPSPVQSYSNRATVMMKHLDERMAFAWFTVADLERNTEYTLDLQARLHAGGGESYLVIAGFTKLMPILFPLP